jgi:N-acetylmuramoyl-L-alanine amidase
MKITSFYSPNYSKTYRTKKSINVIVLHYTGMQSERDSIKRLCNIKSKVSSHYLINRKGKIYRLVKDNKVAWHAGKSCWCKFKNLNENSIGIELVNKGHEFGYVNFTNKQIFKLLKLCKFLAKQYKIKNKNIVGHSDIAPLRKKDPGEKFPWKYLAENNIGIWHNYNSIFLKKLRKVKITNKKDKVFFLKNLKKIGYCFSYRKKAHILKTVKAFQRHFRKELINGLIDKECLLISSNLLKKI